jgi:hypothetical protein
LDFAADQKAVQLVTGAQRPKDFEAQLARALQKELSHSMRGTDQNAVQPGQVSTVVHRQSSSQIASLRRVSFLAPDKNAVYRKLHCFLVYAGRRTIDPFLQGEVASFSRTTARDRFSRSL